jgi:ABC-2 type transport system ATP-binding protein
MAIIEVKDLEKVFKLQKRQEGFSGILKGLFNPQYEEKPAVNKVSFEIPRGEIVGYIGPNGAGKSTTIKMLVGILVPTSGEVLVNGIVPYKNRINNSKNIGVVFGQRTQLWWDIPVTDSLNIMKYLYKIPEDRFKQNLRFLIEILDMGSFINTPVRQLSLGQRMRADLCAALLHNPPILFLDEPTIGLDVVIKERIRKFINEINQQYKTTVILTTHDISDIEKLCSRVIVINKGKNVFDGKLEELRNSYGYEEGF